MVSQSPGVTRHRQFPALYLVEDFPREALAVAVGVAFCGVRFAETYLLPFIEYRRREPRLY